jgi:hypothetical protein
MFANAPIQPTVVEVQVLRISFDARADTAVPAPSGYKYPAGRPIGSPMVADLSVWSSHAEQLGERARAKGIEISIWPP